MKVNQPLTRTFLGSVVPRPISQTSQVYNWESFISTHTTMCQREWNKCKFELIQCTAWCSGPAQNPWTSRDRDFEPAVSPRIVRIYCPLLGCSATRPLELDRAARRNKGICRQILGCTYLDRDRERDREREREREGERERETLFILEITIN